MDRRVTVYQATHSNSCMIEKDYMIPIQAGAALTENRIADLTDDIGDNISRKNRQYCELTVLYWIWKNSKSDYVGLCHYRRKFSFEQQSQIISLLDDYDAIVACPYQFRINLKREYEKYHRKQDLEVLMEILEQRNDGSADTAKEVLADNLLYPYNMMIMKKIELEKYCKWLFEILEEIETRIKPGERSEYQNRYIGFLAERLFTIYIKRYSLRVYSDSLQYENKRYGKKEKKHSRINGYIFKIKKFFGGG